MKNVTKYGWLLILSVPIITAYCWVVMIISVISSWPFRGGGGGWLVSFLSITTLLGAMLLLFWVILALVMVVALSHEAYSELTPQEQEVVGRVARNAMQEFLRRMRRRKDRLGKIVRLGDKLTKEV